MKNGRFTNWIIFIVTAAIWGSSYILMKRGTEEIPATQVAALRIFFAFCALTPFLIGAIKHIPRDRYKYIAIVGCIGSALPATLYAVSVDKEGSILAGMLNSLTPLFTLLIGVLFFKIKGNWAKYLGVFVGLLGACALVLFKGGQLHFSIYALMPVLATLCYGLSSNVLKQYLNDIKPHHLVSMQFSIIAIPALAYILMSELPSQLSAASFDDTLWSALGYVAILGAVNTAMALFLFNHLIQRTSALYAAMVTYLIPVMALFWGIVDGESVGSNTLVGIALILAGIYIINMQRQSQQTTKSGQ